MADNKIKLQIAALLAMAEGTNNQFEADSFMAKVNELLEKHQVELHEIRGARERIEDPMGKERGETNLYASIKWARDVAGTLARYYGCQFVYYRHGNHFRYDIVGRESARTTFELMLPFVISQVKVQAKRVWMEYGGDAHRTLAVWERQVGQALWVRLGRMLPAAQARREELVANALVPVDDLQAFMDAEFPDLTTGRSTKVSFSTAAKNAADKVSLHHQATGKHTKLLS